MPPPISRRDFLTRFGREVAGAVVLAHTAAAGLFAPQTPVDTRLTDAVLANRQYFFVGYGEQEIPQSLSELYRAETIYRIADASSLGVF